MILVTVISTQMAFAGGPASRSATDRDLIQGTWRVVKVTDGPDDRPGDGFVNFRGDKFSTTPAPQTQPSADRGTGQTFKLDPSQTPKQIDLAGSGENLKGIYVLDGDHLKLSIHWGDRPASFDHSNSKVVVLVRSRPTTANR